MKLLGIAAGVAALALLGAASGAAHQHGPGGGHLIGTGAWGNIELVSKLAMHDVEPQTIADLSVFKDYLYLSKWGASDCAGPERGGQTSPDGGAYVVDISDIAHPREVGFIATHQDTLVGEGMQGLTLTTAAFSGDVLALNHEGCGKNYKAGFSLFDITNPLKPRKLSEHLADFTTGGVRNTPHDANQYHSVFAWDAGDRGYLVATDDDEATDVDIYDISDPRKPTLLTELDLNDYDVEQPALGLTESFLHDMVVKSIGGHWIMLLSYWDGGYVQLNVDDPEHPVFIGDTDYATVDPELLESAGISLTPEGNGHQNEFTADNRFFIGTDEDFGPYRVGDFTITTGPHAGTYPSVHVGGAASPSMLPDASLNGPVVYGGYGCPASAAIPSPASVPGYLASLSPGEEKIVVLQRGPVGDPSAPEPACFPGEKAHQAVLAGWDAVLFVQRHGGEEDPPFCGSGGFVDVVVGVCTNHEAYHKLFDTPVNFATYPDGPAIGAIGQKIAVDSEFDGWGYVHLFDAATLADLDTFAIDEAHDPAFASGFGDLSVHEVATDKTNPLRAYLSYYAGGIRSLEIQCSNPESTSTCELVEIGGYLDEHGNDFWGIETFVRGDTTYVAGSDRDYGVFIVRVTS